MLKNAGIASLVLVLLFFSFSVLNSTQEFSDSKPLKSEYTASSTILAFLESKDAETDTVTAEFDSIYDKHDYFAKHKNKICKEFSRIDSLKLWNKKGEIIDPDSTWTTLEGSGWNYGINDSLEYYVYGVFAESQRWLYSYYVKNGDLLVHIGVNTKYNAPLGYIREDAYAAGDSTEWGESEDFEELSIFRNNKIIYQLSPDCGAPNSPAYIQGTQEGIINELATIRNLIKLQE